MMHRESTLQKFGFGQQPSFLFDGEPLHAGARGASRSWKQSFALANICSIRESLDAASSSLTLCSFTPPMNGTLGIGDRTDEAQAHVQQTIAERDISMASARYVPQRAGLRVTFLCRTPSGIR